MWCRAGASAPLVLAAVATQPDCQALGLCAAVWFGGVVGGGVQQCHYFVSSSGGVCSRHNSS